MYSANLLMIFLSFRFGWAKQVLRNLHKLQVHVHIQLRAHAQKVKEPERSQHEQSRHEPSGQTGVCMADLLTSNNQQPTANNEYGRWAVTYGKVLSDL
jgi:hypothetical protein